MNDKHILVIDDEGIILFSIREDLEDEGYIIDTARSGEEGIEKLKAKEYDLIITDLIMSPKDGFDVIDEVIKLNCEAKIIVMTGYMGDDSIKETLKPSISIVMKPFSREELIEKVRNCLMDN